MYLVLNEEVDQRDESPEKQASKGLPVSYRFRIGRT